jgi:8-amino-7-oxononanoate synthase
VRAAERCLENGVRIGSFRPPSVPDGISRLRLTAHSGLSDADLDRACEVVVAAIEEVS